MNDLILEVVEGEDAGRQVPLQGMVELGRDDSLEHAVDDEQISRRHVRISPADGAAEVEDLGSLNGTFVNDSPIEAATRIGPGDRVRIGLTVLELRRLGAAQRGTVAADPLPRLTNVGAEVLEPASEKELERANAPRHGAVAAEEQPAAFVPERALGSVAEGTSPDYERIARLVDTRVKRRTNAAAFALLAVASLAVIVYFGAA